jgi:glyoxalase superfamily protein
MRTAGVRIERLRLRDRDPGRNDGRMAHLQDIVVDARHPASIARFWAAVLDGYEVAPYDEAEVARLRAKGIFDLEDDPMVVVERVAGAGPRLLFQLVAEPKTVKNRVHLDLSADGSAAEVPRLLGLGARVLAEHDSFLVLADPEGNEFCVSRR